MYLKTIEVLGFKSFADKTRIEVKKGITGVIGPNGCGKSNIMEAIRWCIGEMSWKSLRSDSMVSVIFQGTERRNAMGLSEVTLTFDNARSLLPVQYSEVQVTRRIFRSGESEYYLNKTQCRLRDIRELFLDTGIGNGGYAIIDQGQVGFILESKPEDRRGLFEEAAGVAKYKAKREEAIRKMDRVEVDLGRLQDSVSLINEQIKKLDAEARKANLHQKYKAELAAMEAGHIIKQVGRIDADLAAEEAVAGPLSQKIGALQNALDADDGRLAALSLERKSQEDAVVEAGSRVSDIRSEKGRLEERIESAKRIRSDLEKQIALYQEEIENEQGLAERMGPDIDSARADHEGADQRLAAARAERESFRAELDAAAGKLEAAEAVLDEVAKRRLSLAEEEQTVSRERQADESRCQQLSYELDRGQRESVRKQEQAAASAQDLERLERDIEEQRAAVDAAAGAVGELESERGALRAGLESLRQRLFDLRSEDAALGARVAALEAQGGKDPYWAGANAVAASGIPGIAGTVGSLLDFDEAHRPLIEDALGDRINAVVCDDLSAAGAGVEFLRTMGRGRARFIVMGSLLAAVPEPRQVPVGARALLDMVRFDPVFEPLFRVLLNEGFSLNGMLHQRYWVCGGAGGLESSSPRLSDIASLRDRREACLREAEGADRERSSSEGSLAALEPRLADARAAREALSEALHRLSGELQVKKDSLQLFREEVESMGAERERLGADMGEARRRIEEAEKRAAGFAESRRAMEAEVEEAKAGEAALREDITRREARQEHLDEGLRQRESNARLMRSRFEDLVERREEYQRGIARRMEQQQNARARIEEELRAETESGEKLDALRIDLSGAENEARLLQEKLQATQKEAEDLGAKVRKSKREVDGFREDLHKSEMRLSQLRSTRATLCERLMEEWELSIQEAQLKFQDQPVDEERIDWLRRRIAALGNVNPSAPEEYEELVKKRDYLQGQIDDLNQAKYDLRSVITKINSTTRENFRQTFHEVREHFRKLYGILFEGGEADLRLTDPENLLETGIEIVAQPPGKKLLSISQLSGGEKTLTAVALLFAFFMVRPSPMCMLDEADAALDDANVDRFVLMLREFVDKTQFLIVSHNKKTMEACDAIYGVTMEEAGVSQLFSVDFKKQDEVDRLLEERPAGTETAPA